MAHPTQESLQNRLLRQLPAESFARLRAQMEPARFNKGQIVVEANTSMEWAYFPESGIASVVSSNQGRRVEVGLFGRDGMGGTALVMGIGQTPHEAMAQVPGHGYRIPADSLRRAMAQDPALHGLLLRYVHALSVQTAQTALSNATGSINQRLARWLLLSHDRIDGDDLPLTHEFLAIMLGVRRPGVTLATHALEGAQVIRAQRGIITVIDRAKLERIAGELYGPAEAEYERLLGPLRRSCPRSIRHS